MRKIREVLRLRLEAGLSIRQISASTKTSVGAIQKLLARADALNLNWPLPEDLDDGRLAALFYPGADPTTSTRYQVPDWATVHQELKRKGMTKQLLWEEYTAQYPNRCYSYSQYCDRYRHWLKQQKRSMRQTHKAGEKCFVDYCGPTVPIINPQTGEVRTAQVFVAVLGASNYTYAEATWSQSLRDWLSSHVRTFEFFGGIPEMVVPDNLRSGVSKACRYDPELNPSYQQLAEHYQVAGCRVTGKQPSRHWISQPCVPCRNSPMSTSRSGVAGSISITTSSSTSIITRYRTSTWASRWKSRPAIIWCRSTSGNARWQVTHGVTGRAPPPKPVICLPGIENSSNGPRGVSRTGPGTSGQTR